MSKTKEYDFRPFEYHMMFSFAIIAGVKYLMPLWESVPMDCTYDDIRPYYTKKEYVPQTSTFISGEWEIPNSKNTGTYTVTARQNNWSCTCVGYGFRRKCKHIEIAKQIKK